VTASEREGWRAGGAKRVRFVEELKKSEGADAAEGNRDAPDTPTPGKRRVLRAGSLAPHHVTNEEP
jgi:hypothetical protein